MPQFDLVLLETMAWYTIMCTGDLADRATVAVYNAKYHEFIKEFQEAKWPSGSALVSMRNNAAAIASHYAGLATDFAAACKLPTTYISTLPADLRGMLRDYIAAFQRINVHEHNAKPDTAYYITGCDVVYECKFFRQFLPPDCPYEICMLAGQLSTLSTIGRPAVYFAHGCANYFGQTGYRPCIYCLELNRREERQPRDLVFCDAHGYVVGMLAAARRIIAKFE